MNLQTVVSIFHVPGASGTVFGSKGSASFLSRTTGVLAALFFGTSLTLAYLSGQQEGPVSILEATPGVVEGVGEIPGILVPDDEVDLPALPAEQAVVEEEEAPGNE
jgi:preprotein translocase subunit SecG